jgi:SAM-dependent methyltransferase
MLAEARLEMEAEAFSVEAAAEETHWWFVGRRKLFAEELRRIGVAQDARVLDVGTGTGSNLRMLREVGFQHVSGLDANDDAIRYCELKGLGLVKKGDICAMPFSDATFDLVLATDVIEHVDDDERALAEVARVLKPGGRALFTVPAFQSLWGLQDRQALHKRRYRLRPLLSLQRSAGFEIEQAYYFNYLLFLPIWIARRVIDFFGVDLKSEGEVNTPFINRILLGVFALDINTARLVRAPFGVSILVVAKK